MTYNGKAYLTDKLTKLTIVLYIQNKHTHRCANSWTEKRSLSLFMDKKMAYRTTLCAINNKNQIPSK